jgi:addiction module RelB/DinJ family antitoxin
MTELFRCRIERKLLTKVARVAEQMGTTPGELVRLLFTHVVKRREIPFQITADAESDLDLLDVPRRNRILRELDDSEGW